MRRFIIIILTLCLLGFSASAFARGPENTRSNAFQASQHRQNGPQAQQQRNDRNDVHSRQCAAHAPRHVEPPRRVAMQERHFQPAPHHAHPAPQPVAQVYHDVTIVPVTVDSGASFSGSISTDLMDVSVSIYE